jgi:hypothetical protein
MRPELDLVRLGRLGELLACHPRQRVAAADLWRYFDTAFPQRPQGAEERQWFLAALEHLAHSGIIRLPALAGTRWDRKAIPPIPFSVDLVREGKASHKRWHRDFAWHARLQWIAGLPILTEEQSAFLKRVQEGLSSGLFEMHVPVKYRSLQLTGHEKRLQLLAKTRLFGPDRLTLDLLGCVPDAPPLAWEDVSDRPDLIVFENAGAFRVAHKVLSSLGARSPYGLIAYGGGACFTASIGYLQTISRDVQSITYVGDIDAAGAAIAAMSCATAKSIGLPRVVPANALHRAMLDGARRFGYPQGWPCGAERLLTLRDATLAWYGDDMQAEIAGLIGSGRRIPEEVLGPKEYQALWG